MPDSGSPDRVDRDRDDAAALTWGTLLGGRVAYAQPAGGHRSGLEPVLLAAAVPARAGERVLEGGTGAGAALLCLAARVPGIAGLGVEIEPGVAEVARRNFASCATAALTAAAGDITGPATGAAAFDHAMANPPWHDAGGTPSPDPARRLARRAGSGGLEAWIGALARATRRRGTVTAIVGAAHAPAVLEAFAAHGLGGATLLPFWSRADQPARIALLQGTRGSRAPFRLLAGLVLHTAGGGYTPAALAVLRDGAPLPMRPVRPERSRSGAGTGPAPCCTDPAPPA